MQGWRLGLSFSWQPSPVGGESPFWTSPAPSFCVCVCVCVCVGGGGGGGGGGGSYQKCSKNIVFFCGKQALECGYVVHVL